MAKNKTHGITKDDVPHNNISMSSKDWTEALKELDSMMLEPQPFFFLESKVLCIDTLKSVHNLTNSF